MRFKPAFFTLALIVLTVLSSSLSRAEHSKVTAPFFYEISKNGHTSYMLGSYHLGVSLADYPLIVVRKIKSATKIYVEVTMNAATVHSLLTDSTSFYLSILSQRNRLEGSQVSPLSPILKAALVAHGMPAEIVIELRCNDYSNFIFSARSSFPKMVSVDYEVIDYANLNNIPLIALDRAGVRETADKLVRKTDSCLLTDKLAPLEPVLPLLDRVQHEELNQYLHGQYNDKPGADVEYRTAVWMSELEDDGFGKTDGAVIVVGTDHLMGPKGLIQLLRDRGYQVRQVRQRP